MTNKDATKESKFLPFWATPQYGGGLVQGIGIAFASLFLINEVSADFFDRYKSGIGILGFVLIVVGGLRARKVP